MTRSYLYRIREDIPSVSVFLGGVRTWAGEWTKISERGFGDEEVTLEEIADNPDWWDHMPGYYLGFMRDLI